MGNFFIFMYQLHDQEWAGQVVRIAKKNSCHLSVCHLTVPSRHIIIHDNDFSNVIEALIPHHDL